MFHLQRSGWRDLYQLIIGLQSLNQLLAELCSFHDTPGAQSFKEMSKYGKVVQLVLTLGLFSLSPITAHLLPPLLHPQSKPPIPHFDRLFRVVIPLFWVADPLFGIVIPHCDRGRLPFSGRWRVWETSGRLPLSSASSCTGGGSLGALGEERDVILGFFSINCFNLLVPEADQTGQPSGWHHFHKCNPHLAQIFFSPLLVFRNSSSC